MLRVKTAMPAFLLLAALCAALLAAVPASAQPPAPAQAAAQGYTVNTFHSSFQDEVDTRDTRQPRFKWFTGQFFGGRTTPWYVFDKAPDGALLMRSGGNGAIATAVPVPGARKWAGKTFGGGGYFEAEFKIDTQLTGKAKSGWPSFWAMGVEHMAGLPQEQWPGQLPGYAHFIEVDIFEYFFKDPEPGTPYLGTLHDWYGQYKRSCPSDAFCKIDLPYAEIKRRVPPGTNYNDYHRYGFLWVPATQSSDGYGQFYFDGNPVGQRVTWKRFTNQDPSHARQPWSFGILDKQHLVLLLGPGDNQPMMVRQVNVWQKSDAGNLSQ